MGAPADGKGKGNGSKKRKMTDGAPPQDAPNRNKAQVHLLAAHEKSVSQLTAAAGLLIYLPLQIFLAVEAAAAVWKQAYVKGQPHPSQCSCADVRLKTMCEQLLTKVAAGEYTADPIAIAGITINAMQTLDDVSKLPVTDLRHVHADFEYRKGGARDQADAEKAKRPYLFLTRADFRSLYLRHALLSLKVTQGVSDFKVVPFTGTKRGPLANAAFGQPPK